MKHLKNEGSASAHLNFSNVEPEPEESFEEGALSIGLASDRHDLRDREGLAERHRGTLQPVVGFKPGLGVGEGVAPVGPLGWGFGGRGEECGGSVGAGDGGGRHGGGGGREGKESQV